MISWRDALHRIRHSDPAFTLPFAFGLGIAAVTIVWLVFAGMRSI